ncbi:helix-turn-helix transcriptional regulator [Leptolyngbya sp. ST-U4]|uniref:helix-turn-helix transcriptional regulator n=1 Tax=Leptolyngbya sp. ST-U4 TaxID=2933912 RepID=UPI00198C1C1E|nr:helix-turn-helix transcriptional regulator [Cyanobacteria bacterium FACHB-502]
MNTANTDFASIDILIPSERDLCRLTQEQFAAKLGVSLVTINRWENDRAKPIPIVLRQVKSLQVELTQPERVLGRTPKKSRQTKLRRVGC